jgi:hypothetical protein
MLRAACGSIYVDRRLGAHFGGRYIQRLELKQPSPTALQWLAGHPEALINRMEIAVDYIFADINQKDDAFYFLHQHLLRRWHGKKQKVKLVRRQKRGSEVVDEMAMGQTRYDAGRGARNGIVFYGTKPSRITGELDCLHLEWRINGKDAVQAVGIKTGDDLLKFDHYEFWKKRLLFYRVDEARLGRLYRNHHSGKKRRFSSNADKRTGHVLINSVGSIQELIDQYGSVVRLQSVLQPIRNDWLLPTEEISQQDISVEVNSHFTGVSGIEWEGSAGILQ